MSLAEKFKSLFSSIKQDINTIKGQTKKMHKNGAL